MVTETQHSCNQSDSDLAHLVKNVVHSLHYWECTLFRQQVIRDVIKYLLHKKHHGGVIMIIITSTSKRNFDGYMIGKMMITKLNVDHLEQLSAQEKLIIRRILELDFPGIIMDLYRKNVSNLDSSSEGSLVGKILIRTFGRLHDLGSQIPEDLDADYRPETWHIHIDDVPIRSIQNVDETINGIKLFVEAALHRTFLDTAKIYREFYQKRASD